MADEIKEIIATEPNWLGKDETKKKKKKEHNPMDYVMIPVKEYRKLIRKIEHLKAEREAAEELAKEKEYTEQYRIWWHKEQDEAAKLREALEDAKSQLKELLGVEEASDEQG